MKTIQVEFGKPSKFYLNNKRISSVTAFGYYKKGAKFNFGGKSKTDVKIPDGHDIILELFSGTGSVTHALTPKFLRKISPKRKVTIVSLDLSDKFYKPTIKENILDWDYKSFIDAYKGRILYIHGSPPCAPHSRSNTRKHKNPKKDKKDKANSKKIWKRVADIITYAKPKAFALENPWTSDILECLDRWFPGKKMFKNRVRGDYCAYGFKYQKQTLFITSNPKVTLRKCPKPKNLCHATKENRKTKRWVHITNIEDIPNLGDRYSIPHPIIRAVVSQNLNVPWKEKFNNIKK